MSSERERVTVNLTDPAGNPEFHIYTDALTDWLDDGNVLKVSGVPQNGHSAGGRAIIMEYPRERVFSIKRG